MSETIDDNKDQRNELNQENVCRDFIRGVCDRKFCKYKHENEIRSLNFCHDFQNSSCPRPNCKFIHCSTEEVEEYKKNGEMSNQILAEATRKNQLPGVLPVCNLFRKGTCRRTYCKYRHITKEEEDAEIMELIQNNNRNKFCINNNFNDSQLHLPGRILRKKQFDDTNDFVQQPLPPKRRFISNEPDFMDNLDGDDPNNPMRNVFKGYFAGNPPPMLNRLDARTIMLEEQNSLLLKEIAQLKRQVSDLTATNEFLLDQNANLRVSSKRNTSVNVPAVTITNSLPPNNTPPQQQVIRTVPASVTTVPVSLATVSTCNPVSGNPVSIAGCPAVSIASPAQILAPSQQILVTTNPSTQLAIANSSQAQLAIAQQNLANNLAQQGQQQLTSQAQQLALATTTQQLTSQAQHIANQQLALASAPQQLTSQPQQITITNSTQQLALANSQQSHQAISQAQQLANQQLTSQAQQLALANTPQQLAVAANVSQQLALASTNQQLLAQQNLASNQQLELHRNNQLTINTTQTIAMSNSSQPMVSYPIMTQSLSHAMPH